MISSNDFHELVEADDAYITVAADQLKLALLMMFFLFVLFCRRLFLGEN
jgi:hypothetical protein